MRVLAGLLVLVTLLTACSAPFGDGALPLPTGAPVAANVNAATATRSTASATSSVSATVPVAVRTPTNVLATVTRGATGTAVTPIPTGTPTPTVAAPTPTRTATPFPVRPGPPAVTPSVVATPGMPGLASPIAGTPGTPRAATPVAGATPGTPGTPGTPTAATSDQNRTTTQIFAPYRPDGLVKNLRANATISGYCVSGSQSLPGRPDAWRCASGGRILDPCFASSTPDTQPLACAVAPWSDDITLLNLTAPLPRDRANSVFSVAANPWGLQLPSGVRCQALPAGSTAIAGMDVTATCADGSQLLGNPDRSGGRWRIFVMRDNSASLELQEIVAVWY